jgi:hypothetical protein
MTNEENQRMHQKQETGTKFVGSFFQLLAQLGFWGGNGIPWSWAGSFSPFFLSLFFQCDKINPPLRQLWLNCVSSSSKKATVFTFLFLFVVEQSKMDPTGAQLSYRERIAAMYAKYCPEKPMSHVDFLLVKYAGYEEDVLETLRQKYGPEPNPPIKDYQQRVSSLLGPTVSSPAERTQVAKALVESYPRMEEHLIYSLMDRLGSEPKSRLDHSLGNPQPGDLSGSGAGPSDGSRNRLGELLLEDPDEALRRRQERLRQDLASLQSEQQKRNAVRLSTSSVEIAAKIRLQDAEIQRLSSSIADLDSQASRREIENNSVIEGLASQLVALKMKKLRMESKRNPALVSALDLHEAQQRLDQARKAIQDCALRTRACEEVLSKHLSLYPITPVRQVLRRLDPALCARLDELQK